MGGNAKAQSGRLLGENWEVAGRTLGGAGKMLEKRWDVAEIPSSSQLFPEVPRILPAFNFCVNEYYLISFVSGII